MKSQKRRRIVLGQSREDWEREIILESGKFDLSFYLEQLGQELSLEEAVNHYVEVGQSEGLRPNPDFDVEFYRATNKDLAEVGIGPFAHFIKLGAGEGRYQNRQQVKQHAAELASVRGSLEIRNTFGERDSLAESLDLGPVEAHLAYGWRTGARLVGEFEDATYFRLYGSEGGLGVPPLIHYTRIGAAAGYFKNRKELVVHREVIEEEFDEQYYEAQGRLNSRVSAVDEFCAVGWRVGRNPNRRFNTRFYLDMYADIRSLNISPFHHFLTSGKKEGRLPGPMLEQMVRAGSRSFDPTLRTVIVAVHEASRTGAPLLGLEIGRHLAERFNVIFVVLKGGELVKDFSDHATYVVSHHPNIVQLTYLFTSLAQKFDQLLLIANSVETVEVAEAAAVSGIATIGLIHEFADYTLPPGKISRMALAADIVVTPAELVAASVRKETERVGQFPSNNIRVRPQGKLENLGGSQNSRKLMKAEDIREAVRAIEPDVKIVLGAGHVQTRKGVDIFVQTAHEVVRTYGDNVRFVWVGGGYHPDSDIVNSVWIRSAIERLDLTRHVYFFPEQPNIEAFYEVADLFYLSSRLDPFPNVAIDSIAAGKKIVCFDKATGVAEWIADGRIDGALAGYGNVSEAGRAITRLLGTPTFSEKNHQAGTTRFLMEHYIDDLLKFGEEAIGLRARIIQDAEEIQERKLLDENYFAASNSISTRGMENALKYSTWSRKGLVVWNPRPGLSEGKYRVEHGLVGQSVNILLEAADKLPELRTHLCHSVDDLPDRPSSLRIAIHLHLHYSDLASEFAKRFTQAIPEADLFITVPSDKARREVDYEFRDHPGNSSVWVVENRGRDIAPMLDVLREHHRDYDVFGHFHGKKSLFAGGDTGDMWRSFLMETLVGKSEVTSKLMALFEDDLRLGLVFAEDRLNAGWTKNGAIASDLAHELKLERKPAAYPTYPIGTMFWMRPAALMPLIASKLTAREFPPEPLPDDGTSLHALERLIPTIVESSGYHWCTVRRNGINRRF